MTQITLEQSGEEAPPLKPPQLPEEPSENAQLGEQMKGEREFIRGRLSKSGLSYRLVVSGDLGPREIDRLIRVLETQRDILTDDDEEN